MGREAQKWGRDLPKASRLPRGLEESKGSPHSQSTNPTALLSAGDKLAPEQERHPPSSLTEPGQQELVSTMVGEQMGWGGDVEHRFHTWAPAQMVGPKAQSGSANVWFLTDPCLWDQPWPFFWA